MDIRKLMSGIGIIIDDEIDQKDANVQKIVDQIEEARIPLLKYSSLLEDDVISHLHSISFLILDWRLIKDEIDDDFIIEGFKIPEGIKDNNKESNLEFLRKVSDNCYNPVFIFTNESIDEINEIINGEFGFSDEKPNNFFIMSKSELEESGQFLKKIESWITKNPSIYLLKEWEMQYKRGKFELFTQFYKYSSYWPNILWKNFNDDGANPSIELNELIIRNLKSRMVPYEFDKEVLEEKIENLSPKELCDVLEGERYIPVEFLDEKEISTGDLFKSEQDNEIKYFLNIRAQCDLARDKNPKLYLLKGKVLTRSESGKFDNFNEDYGMFMEKVNNCIIPFIDCGAVIEFKLAELKVETWNSMKKQKIGKVLPPYITKIQQKYAAYHQRQGLPRIPSEAITEI